MVWSYTQLSKSGTGVYNHTITQSNGGNRVVRSPETNGGGSINGGVYSGDQTLTVSVYLPTVDDVTVSGAIQAVKL